MTISKLLKIVRDENPEADAVVTFTVAAYEFNKGELTKQFALVIINADNYKDWASKGAKNIKELYIQYLAWKIVREQQTVQLVHVLNYNPAVHRLRDSDPLGTVQPGDRVVLVEVCEDRQIVVPIVE